MNPYETCPVFENENFLLRLVTMDDAADLLSVYSDKKAVPLFNSDNCNGDDFHYTTLERMQQGIEFWLWAYKNHSFVRWSIFDKKIGKGIGTIELFNRKAEDYFNDCGLLRLDLRSDYEDTEHIMEILSLILPHTCKLFGCQMIATKIPPFAAARRTAAAQLGFLESKERVGGKDQEGYADYYVMWK